MTTQGSDLIANVTDAVPDDSIVHRMRKQGCRAKLDRLEGERLIIDVDRIVPDGEKKCDYLLISNQPLIAPIEMKSGEVGASEAKGQLQAGANFANEIIAPKHLKVDLKPIVFSKGIDPTERQLLKRGSQFVQFRGKRYEITLASCGSSLVDALRRGT